MNSTILKFGFPDTLLFESAEWLVLLRPEQITLGSLILAAKAEVTAFGALGAEAFVDLNAVIARIERALGRTVAPEKLNYLMLMMVDPHVHFHVIPRYAGTRSHAGLALADEGWPKPPAFGTATAPDADQQEALLGWLRAAFDEA